MDVVITHKYIQEVDVMRHQAGNISIVEHRDGTINVINKGTMQEIYNGPKNSEAARVILEQLRKIA